MKKKRNLNMSKVLVVLASCLLATVLAQPETLITLELTGGDHAGSYQVTQEDSSCLYGSSNGDDWRTLYSSDSSEAGGLSTVLLLIPSTTAAASGSMDFFFSAGFGEYSSDEYLEYILDSPNGNGSGTVTVEKDGHYALLTISGQTSAGVEVNATITCNTVLELSTEPKALSELGEVKFAPDSNAPTGSLSLTIADKSYQVQTGEEATCTRDAYDTAGLFLYSYYVDGYNNLDLFIPDLEAAKNGTSDFGFALDSFYLIYRTGEGSGTVEAIQTGDKLTLTVDVQSPEGIPVQATLECPFE
jgi:hypothetical protein